MPGVCNIHKFRMYPSQFIAHLGFKNQANPYVRVVQNHLPTQVRKNKDLVLPPTYPFTLT